MTDPLFEKVYNETVVKSLEKRFGPLQRQHVEMTVATDMMLRMVDKMNDKPRRGEVVMVVPADRAGAESQVWVHTKAFYPEGIYRLMTGGLELNEVPPQALLREVEEETGFKTKIDRCLAAITYTFMSDRESISFVSYVFLTEPLAGTPQLSDSGELITAFKAVPVAALADIALQLRSLEGKYADWGNFRAIAHELVWQQLK